MNSFLNRNSAIVHLLGCFIAAWKAIIELLTWKIFMRNLQRQQFIIWETTDRSVSVSIGIFRYSWLRQIRCITIKLHQILLRFLVNEMAAYCVFQILTPEVYIMELKVYCSRKLLRDVMMIWCSSVLGLVPKY